MLTERVIAALNPPEGQAQIRIQDERQRGLYLVVGKATKTWMLKRRNRWVRVGGWPALSPAAARQRTLELLAADDTGRPMGLTVEAAYGLWKKQKPRAASTLRNHREYLTLHFGDWQDTDLAKISRVDMQRRHEKVTRDRGPKAANNGAKGFRAWWSAAQKLDPHLPACPTIAINWHAQRPVDESALLARLPEWSTGLDTAVVNPLRRTMLRFMLLTGLRSGDVKTMRWDAIRGDTLFVPNPKGGSSKAFTLPLTAAHVELLGQARPHSRGQRVFPLFNARLSPGEVKRFGDLRWSPHSLRRVFISTAVEAGLTPFEIALLVNHKVPGVTFGYVAKASDMRPAMERVVARLQARLAAE
ncbi:integrase family protein [Roseomonas sp. CECT 9278]|uniref:integrase family protein n=1 Tax=Roseomonas sp. CECT 9278 TaxID=2845823 RepID=UPI001E36295A|nr:integrase family protein [Roseomonas sp. CECT 9278]CAH0134441.1 hypothetical protein ROS9278_00315 [Roseomonas sp. CECT 9278]